MAGRRRLPRPLLLTTLDFNYREPRSADNAGYSPYTPRSGSVQPANGAYAFVLRTPAPLKGALGVPGGTAVD